MRIALIAGVFFLVLLAAVSVASAQQFSTTVNYPDGSVSFNQNFGAGINARIFVDTPGDFDIFTHHTNSVGAFVNLTIQGFPAGIAYWLNFIGTSYR